MSDISIDLQSQGKSVAELQVSGMTAALTKRPVDSTVAMAVHSLLLVDALQVRRELNLYSTE